MYVATMLMLLVLMTYGRLESFRGFSYIQSEFKQYMEKHEREFINDEAIRQYNDTVAKSTNPTANSDQEKSEARSLVMFNLFINKQEREAHPKEFDQLNQITRNLIAYLYGDQPFYKKLEEKRPNFVSEIFQALIRETDGLNEKDKLKKIGELSTVDLRDFELNEVFTSMLKGSIELHEKIPQSENVGIRTEEGRQVFKPNFQPIEGYYSLLDFLTLDKGNYKIRIFLASPQLLMAIFGNPSIVYDILQTRYDLYKAVKSGMDPKEAEKTFLQQYLNQRLSYINSETLDFGVSKTNPRNYE
jgi:hypothetical protein